MSRLRQNEHKLPFLFDRCVGESRQNLTWGPNEHFLMELGELATKVERSGTVLRGEAFESFEDSMSRFEKHYWMIIEFEVSKKCLATFFASDKA